MSPAETLRKMASEARGLADRLDSERREKAACVVRAAAGLGALKIRLKGTP